MVPGHEIACFHQSILGDRFAFNRLKNSYKEI